MKKIFQAIGMISLICLSFIFTEKTVEVVKEKDEVMLELKEKKDTYFIAPTDAKIEKNTLIPGLSGKEIDINRSYEKMKRYGSFLESLIEYKEVKPKKSLSKNYDKYIIRGNPEKNMITLLFLVEGEVEIEPFLKKLEKTNTKVTFFFDGNWFEKNNTKVLNIMEKGYEVGNLSYDRNYQDSSFVWMDTIIKRVGEQKTSYCYSEKENLDDLAICAMNKDHTIMPTIKVENHPLKEIKENLKSGSIISLPMNQRTLEEISSIIYYIESKGYTITTLEEHLKERKEN